MRFQDEARIGQKNSLTRVWGQTGSRPAASKDLGFASAYVFGAVCPAHGNAAALIMPICNTAAMNHHLSEISSQVAAPRFREGRLCPCRGDPRWRRRAPQPRSRGARHHHVIGAAAPCSSQGQACMGRWLSSVMTHTAFSPGVGSRCWPKPSAGRSEGSSPAGAKDRATHLYSAGPRGPRP
jgi:hypothetical protein